MKQLAVFLIALVLPNLASAQMDPTAMSILNGGATQSPSSGPAQSDGFETNHYVKKPKTLKKKQRAPASESVSDGPSNEAPAPAPDLQNAQVAPLPGLGGEPAGNQFDNSGVPQATQDYAKEQDANFGHKMRDFFLGGDLDSIDKYRSFLDSADIRKNVIEFTLASSYIYNTSMSPYFYRNYITSAPAAYVGMDLWLTPFLGIEADYRTTLLDAVKDSPTQDFYVSDSQTWFGLGIKFRRFFGMSVNSSSITMGLKYTDFTFAVSSAAQNRLTTDSQGPQLTLDVNLPSRHNYSWDLGVILDPYISHNEIPVGPLIQSGASNQTVGMGVSLGGESTLSRQTRVFFKFSTLVYKSVFAGQSTALDPITGASQLNVPVNNVFYMLDFGIKLGR